MIEALKFVKGAVARKDYVPALTHFSIKDGFIRGYNGQIALCSPISLDTEATPKASVFIKAIEACKDIVQISLTATNRLSIKSGKFKAFIPCIDNELFPDLDLEGEEIKLEKGFLEAINILEPFVSEDASKPWSRGILFRNSSAFVTNNIILIEYWIGKQFPLEMNIPYEAIREIVRIGESPTSMLVSQNQVVFKYTGDRWLRSGLYTTEWPDVSRILDSKDNTTKKPPAKFYSAVRDLMPFVDNLESIYFLDNELTTSLVEGEGASVDIEGLIGKSRFSGSQLLLLEAIADEVGFDSYPSPCPFIGRHLRGAIVGIKL